MKGSNNQMKNSLGTNTSRGYLNAVSIIVVIIDLHGTASVMGALNVAWAVRATRSERTRSCGLASGWRADR